MEYQQRMEQDRVLVEQWLKGAFAGRERYARLYDAMEPPAGEVPREPPSTRELRERSYEYGLPEYLQHDLDAYKEGLKNGSSLLDCLWGELYGSINAAEIDDGAITPEHADYLRQKFLWGKKNPHE